MGKRTRASSRRKSGYEGFVVGTPRREDPDEVGVERPQGTPIVIERTGSNQITIRYSNSGGWAMRKFICAWLWIGLAVLPSVAWGQEVYTKPVYLVLLALFAFSAALQWLLALMVKIRGVMGPRLVLGLGLAVLVALLALAVNVFTQEDLKRFRPVLVGLLWFVSLTAVVHWLCVRFGLAEVRVDPEQFVHTVRALGLSRTRRWPTRKVVGIASRRPRPHMVAPYPRWVRMLELWGFWMFEGIFPRWVALVVFVIAAAVYMSVRGATSPEYIGYSAIAGIIAVAYVRLLIAVFRPTYPLCVATRRQDRWFGRYLTKQEQWWVAYELRKFMKEIGHPVRHTLYRG